MITEVVLGAVEKSSAYHEAVSERRRVGVAYRLEEAMTSIPTIQENKEPVRRYLEAGFNEGNLAVLDDILAPKEAGHTSSGLDDPRSILGGATLIVRPGCPGVSGAIR